MQEHHSYENAVATPLAGVIVPNDEKQPLATIEPKTLKSRGDQLLDTLEERKEKAMKLLSGDQNKFKRFGVGFMLSVINNNLGGCSDASLVNAFYTCCAYDLDPSSGFGKVFLTKFNDELKVMVGYQGWLDLLMRNPEISDIEAHPVYEDEEYNYEIGNETKFYHKPNLIQPVGQKRQLLFTYALVKFKDGSIKIETATLNEIDEAKKRSKTSHKPDSPWNKHYMAMAQVVALRKLKQFALSTTRGNIVYDNLTNECDNEGPLELKEVH